MIHAWVDRILKKDEIHGLNFLAKMIQINDILTLLKNDQIKTII